jgi:hypothetical protein
VPSSIIYDPLVTTETISQNDVEGWEIRGWGLPTWNINRDDIQVDVPYKFVAVVKSIKSPLIIRNPAWKPRVTISQYIPLPPPIEPSSGVTKYLSNPYGINVTFETQYEVQWNETLLSGGGQSLVVSSLYEFYAWTLTFLNLFTLDERAVYFKFSQVPPRLTVASCQRSCQP